MTILEGGTSDDIKLSLPIYIAGYFLSLSVDCLSTYLVTHHGQVSSILFQALKVRTEVLSAFFTISVFRVLYLDNSRLDILSAISCIFRVYIGTVSKCVERE